MVTWNNLIQKPQENGEYTIKYRVLFCLVGLTLELASKIPQLAWLSSFEKN